MCESVKKGILNIVQNQSNGNFFLEISEILENDIMPSRMIMLDFFEELLTNPYIYIKTITKKCEKSHFFVMIN